MQFSGPDTRKYYGAKRKHLRNTDLFQANSFVVLIFNIFHSNLFLESTYRIVRSYNESLKGLATKVLKDGYFWNQYLSPQGGLNNAATIFLSMLKCSQGYEFPRLTFFWFYVSYLNNKISANFESVWQFFLWHLSFFYFHMNFILTTLQ